MDRQKELARLEEACRDKHWEDTNTTLPYGPHRTRILEFTKGHLAGTSEAKTLRSDPPASLTLFFWNFVAHHQDKPEETREEAWDETCFGPASCSKDEVSNHVWSANGERMLDSWLGSFPCVQRWSCYCNLWPEIYAQENPTESHFKETMDVLSWRERTLWDSGACHLCQQQLPLTSRMICSRLQSFLVRL